MVDFKNYTLMNTTDLSGAMQHTSDVFYTASGYDVFAPLILVVIGAAFLAVGMKLNIENAIPYASFMTSIVAVLLASAGFLDMQYVALTGIITLGSLFFLRSG